MRILTRLLSIVIALVGILVVGNSLVSAQAQNTGSGIYISPVRTELVVSPGETKTVTVTVKNVTSATATYKVIVNDFIAGDNELGQPALILDDNKYAPSHSLKRHIAAIPNVTVNPGESKDVKVSISMPKDAAGGGYFGAVRFLAVGGKQGQNITLSASVGSLILVRVPGDIKESMTLASFDVRKSETSNSASSFFTSNKNLYVMARFKNTGNVHEQPFGKIILKKGDKVLQTTEINNTDPKGNVLPDSIRRFSVKLNKVGMWGKYTVEGNFGYGTTGQLISGKTSFFVLPLILIIVGLIVLGLIVFAIFGLPKAIKRYNANVVRKANRR
jgi:hypothetical protein